MRKSVLFAITMRIYLIIFIGLVLIALFSRIISDEMDAPAISANILHVPATAAVSNEENAAKKAEARTSRPLEIETPIAGTLQGAGWIKASSVHIGLEPKMLEVDYLVNELGLALMAREGEETYATLPNQQAYQEFLTLHFHAPSTDYYPLKFVRHCPLPTDDPSLTEGIFNTFNTSNFTGLRTWIPLEFQFQEDADGFEVRRGVLCINNSKTINEAIVPPPFRITDGPYSNVDPTLYEPPVVQGANRFGGFVFLEFREIPLPGQILVEERRRSMKATLQISEPWAGSVPWRDNQLDPIFGEFRIDELTVPSDRLTRLLDNEYGIKYLPNGVTFVPRPEAEARRAARLAQEAAGKGK